MRFSVRLSACLAAAATVGLAGAALAVPSRTAATPATGEPITIGTSFTLRSAALGQERRINVYLPDGYSKGGRSYPVLYLIDGGLQQDFLHVAGTSQLGAIWGRSSDAIVVGVETKDRRRELVGPTRDPELLRKYPTAGRSDSFRRFIREEVMPAIKARFRTNGYRGVIGESLAGLFIVETFLRAPDTFDAYAAVSPSLWWDKERLSLEAKDLVGTKQAGRPLYLAVGNEGEEMQAAAERVVAALRPSARLCYVPHPDLTHSTIYHAVSPEALQFLFPGDTKPDPQSGFEVPCSPKS